MGSRARLFALVGGLTLPIAGMAILTPGGGITPVKAFNPKTAPAIQQHLLSGIWDDNAAQSSSANFRSSGPSNFIPGGTSGPSCPVNIGSNVKVNQNCLDITAPNFQGRGQAHNETTIAINPSNPNQLIAASNDYRLGDGLAGGTSYSGNNGRTWQDSTVGEEFTRGSDFSGDTFPRMYWQGGGDPSVAWDSHGDAYLTNLHFNRGNVPAVGGASDIPDYSSGVYVYRSVGNGGASWSFPGTAVATSFQPTTPANGLPLLDKPLMTVDTHSSSPFRDRIYVTWTNFATDGTAYIWEAWSQDFARSFSSPVLVSKNSGSLCPNDYSQFGIAPENGNKCDENQFSDPFTGSDGNLYVVYANFNTTQATSTTGDNKGQILISKSTNGGVSFSAPVRAGYYYDLPDCGTYQGQNEFRACVPEQGSQSNSIFRATNYPSGAVDPTNANHVMVAYGSYINKDSNETTPGNGSTGCAPNGTDQDVFTQLYQGVKTAACANKILVSDSTNKAGSFSAGSNDPRTVAIVPQDAAQAHTDQWWQWSAFDKDGEYVVSYYDRQYGNDITNASNDFSLSAQQEGGGALNFTTQRVTTSSMPNPTEFPNANGNSVFMGDYTGLAVWDTAHPLWTDTRQPDLFDCPSSSPPAVCLLSTPNGQIANNEDIFSNTTSF